jgi:hypothetical protein
LIMLRCGPATGCSGIREAAAKQAP